MARDRLSALLGAVRRQQLVGALRAAGALTVRHQGRTWVIDHGRLIDAAADGHAGRALPVEPPPAPVEGRPVSRHLVDEALCLAKFFDKHSARAEVVACSGAWRFPIDATDQLPRLDTLTPARR